METLICRAIRTRTLIAFDYRNEQRVVEPHCHGRASTGRELLLAYQVTGGSSSARLGWKLFELSRTTELRSINEHFTRRPGYDRSDIVDLHCQV